MTKTCRCREPFTTPAARSLRSGQVLHYDDTPAVLVLDVSVAPNKWSAIMFSPLGPEASWSQTKFASNATSRARWHVATSSVTFSVPALDGPLSIDFTSRALAAANHVSTLSPRGLGHVTPLPPLAETPPWVALRPGDTPITPIPVPVEKDLSDLTSRGKKAVVSDGAFAPPAPNPDRYFYESDEDTRLMSDYVAMRLAGHVTNLMVVGPSGFGKTDSAVRLGERLAVPVHIVNCQAITTPEKWIGQMQVDPEKGTYFEVANHIKWVERTHPDCADAPYCILLYDESTRLRPELANNLFSLLDFQQGLEVPQMGRRVQMDPLNIIIATANVGSAYSGAFTMDWALRERFDTTLERKMPPAPEELKVIRTAVREKIDVEAANGMIRVAEHTRTLWKQGEIDSPISTRMLISWARFVAGGYSVMDAAEYTVVPMYSEDGAEASDRAKVRFALSGKVAS